MQPQALKPCYFKLEPEALLTTLRCLARLHYLPPPDWLAAVAAELEADWPASAAAAGAELDSSLTTAASAAAPPVKLTTTAFLFGNLDHRPGDDWLRRYGGAVQAALPRLDANGITHVLWAAAKADWPLGDGLVAGLAAAARDQARSFEL